MHTRTVFFVSDGTGITAETFGNAILAQFEFKPRHVRLPFIDTRRQGAPGGAADQPHGRGRGPRPIVFTTLVNMEVLQVIEDGCKGMLLDMFGTFVRPLEIELGMKSNHRVGRFSRREQEQGVPRPHRGDQLQPGARRRPEQPRPRAGRRDPGRRQPQRQDADLAVPGDAARPEGGQLPADPGGLRAPPAAAGAGAAPQEDLRPDDPARAAVPRSATSAGPTRATPALENCRTRWPRPRR